LGAFRRYMGAGKEAEKDVKKRMGLED